jgi:hypothetical protein
MNLNPTVLQELMLVATFLLTLLNLWNNWHVNRSRSMQAEPIIQAIREEMAVIKSEMVPKGELIERLTHLETAFKMCREEHKGVVCK